MFDEDYYDEFVYAVAGRATLRISSGMVPEDAIVRAITDDHLVPELLNPAVAQSIETHGYHSARFWAARSFAGRLEQLAPDRPADCEDAGMAFDVLFQDVQQILYENDLT